MITDPISDMLTRIRNAQAVKKAALALPYSNIKFAIAKILEKEGFIVKAVMTTESKFPMIQIDLKYSNHEMDLESLTKELHGELTNEPNFDGKISYSEGKNSKNR